MILTIFRSRLSDTHRDAYDEQVRITAARAEQAPGFLGHKMFVAEDGERVTLVEFDTLEHQRAWSLSREHKTAAIAGRRRFYAEYKIQVCSVERQSEFVAERAAPARCPFRTPAEAEATASAEV